jgi:uncharacterized membrane protein
LGFTRRTAGHDGNRVAAATPVSAAAITSTGLTPRTAATMAYLAWWVTGAVFWALEREDRFARFHAAQAVVAFGAVALLIMLFLLLAVLSLSFAPAAFVLLLVAAGATWLGGVCLWLLAMWKVASGDAFRLPLAAGWADRLI